MKFDEKIEENHFITIQKFDFLLLYPGFTYSKWQQKSLVRSEDPVL